MKHILLFDSQCMACGSLANQVKAIAKDRLDVRTLHDPEMKELLNKNYDRWKWEPKLLILTSEKVQVVSSIRLSLRLLRILGVRDSFRVLNLIRKHHYDETAVDLGRRAFIKSTFAALAIIAFGRFDRVINTLYRQDFHDEVGDQGITTEEYGGFLLYSDYLIDHAHSRPKHERLLVSEFATVPEAASLSAARLYMLGDLPLTSKLDKVYLYHNENGEMISAFVRYHLYESNSTQATSVVILANRDFSRPFPVFPTHEWKYDESEEPILKLPEKVNYTPTLGLVIPSVYGFTTKWIADDTLYSVIVEGQVPNQNLAETVVKSLQFA